MTFISVLLKIFWQKFYRNVSVLVLYHRYEFCLKWLIMIGCHGNRKAKFSKKKSKNFFSAAIRGMKLKLCKNSHNISLYINYIFYCRCPCAFVAMATSFHRLIMGKVEIGIYFCVTADILIKGLLKCFWSRPLPTIYIYILPKSLILTGGHGNRKAKFFEKKKKKKKKKRQKKIKKSRSRCPGCWQPYETLKRNFYKYWLVHSFIYSFSPFTC